MRNSMATTLERPDSTRAPTPFHSALQVKGMTCQNCARQVGEALQNVPGVSSATVSLQDARATVRWLPQSHPDQEALLRSLNQAGYEGRVIERPSEQPEHECHSSAWESTLWLALSGTAYLMLGEWAFRLEREAWFRWSALAVATLVQVFAGTRFYRGD